MQSISQKYWTKSMPKVSKLYKEFVKSEKFNQLEEVQKELAQNVIMAFAEGVYEFEGESLPEWDEHGVLCCCPDVFKIKSIKDVNFYKSISPVLSSFFEFLYEQGHKEDGLILAQTVRRIEPKILRGLKSMSY